MGIPVDDLTTTHLDDPDGDSPSSARAELLADVQKMKDLLAALRLNGALVYRTTTEPVANGTQEAVTWQTSAYNDSSIFSLGSPTRLTVPAAAPTQWTRAQLFGQAVNAGTLPSADTEVGVFIPKNGSIVALGPNYAGAGITIQRGSTALQVSTAVIPVAPGDYFELYIDNTANSNTWTVGAGGAGEDTWFCMILLR